MKMRLSRQQVSQAANKLAIVMCPKKISKNQHEIFFQEFTSSFNAVLSVFDLIKLNGSSDQSGSSLSTSDKKLVGFDDDGLSFVVSYIITSYLINDKCCKSIKNRVIDYIFLQLNQKENFNFLNYRGFELVNRGDKKIKGIKDSNYADSWFVDLQYQGVKIFNNLSILEVMSAQSLLKSLWVVPLYSSSELKGYSRQRLSSITAMFNHFEKGLSLLAGDEISEKVKRSIKKQLMLDQGAQSLLLELAEVSTSVYNTKLAKAVLSLAQRAGVVEELLSNKCDEKYTAMSRAILSGNTELIDMLLNYGVQIKSEEQYVGNNLNPVVAAVIFSCRNNSATSLYAVGESFAYIYMRHTSRKDGDINMLVYMVNQSIFGNYKSSPTQLDFLKKYFFRGMMRGFLRESEWADDKVKLAQLFVKTFEMSKSRFDAQYNEVSRAVTTDHLLNQLKVSVDQDNGKDMQRLQKQYVEHMGLNSFFDINMAPVILSVYSLGSDYMNVSAESDGKGGIYIEPLISYVAWVKSVECLRELIKLGHAQSGLKNLKVCLFKTTYSRRRLTHWVNDTFALASDHPGYFSSMPFVQMMSKKDQCLELLKQCQRKAVTVISDRTSHKSENKKTTPVLLKRKASKATSKSQLDKKIRVSEKALEKKKKAVSIDTAVTISGRGESTNNSPLYKTAEVNVWDDYGLFSSPAAKSDQPVISDSSNDSFCDEGANETSLRVPSKGPRQEFSRSIVNNFGSGDYDKIRALINASKFIESRSGSGKSTHGSGKGKSLSL
jgi:hypothetical protein